MVRTLSGQKKKKNAHACTHTHTQAQNNITQSPFKNTAVFMKNSSDSEFICPTLHTILTRLVNCLPKLYHIKSQIKENTDK